MEVDLFNKIVKNIIDRLIERLIELDRKYENGILDPNPERRLFKRNNILQRRDELMEVIKLIHEVQMVE